MRHVAESKKTQKLLERSGGEWIVISFFFDFRAGLGIPNKLEGMLRSLSYQLVKRVPNIENSCYEELLLERPGSIDLQSYMDTMCDMIKSASVKVCAFIDGLDEFGGSSTDLLQTIYALEDRASLKICLASRPEPAFEHALAR